MSLQTKVSLFAGIGLLILFGLLAFLGVRALEESTRRTFDERVVTARMVAQSVDQTLTKALDDLRRFASSHQADPAGITSYAIDTLDDLYQFSGVFNMVFLLDTQGKPVYVQSSRPDSLNYDFMSYPNVRLTLAEGKDSISSDPKANGSNNPVFSISVPLFNKDKLVAIVGGNIDLSNEYMGNWIQSVRLGDTGYSEVVSEQGLVMATTKNGTTGANEETDYAEHYAMLIAKREATQETCYRCHETAGKIQRQEDVLAFAPLNTDGVRGGVAIRQLKSEALAPTRRLERDMLAVGASVFVVGLSLTWLGTRGLVRPIRQLTAASKGIARGDLDTAISSSRNDELGMLARTLEQMRARLKESIEEREARARESEARARALSALNTIASTVSRSLELEKILDDSLDQVLQAMDMEAGAVFLKEETGELKLNARRGAFAESLDEIAGVKVGADYPLAAFSTRILSPGSAKDNGARTLVNVPLGSKDRPLGLMILATSHTREFSTQEVDLLTAIGHQIGMGIDNAHLFRQAQRREGEARALYHIGVEVSRLLDLEKILSSVADNARQLLGADISSLALLDENSQEVYIAASSGPVGRSFGRIRVQIGQGINGKVISTGEPAISEDYLSDPTIAHTVEVDSVIRENGLKGHLAVPLRIGERVFGSLMVAVKEQRRFAEKDLDLLDRFAHQAAIATENARLYKQVQDLAILQERDRIAREMHDGLGQVLGYLILKARSVEDLLKANQLDSALEETHEMRKVARDGYEEVRAGILGLRESAPEGDLAPALEKYLSGFRNQTGIEVTLEVIDPSTTRIPSRVAVQTVRIIQEALTNVRKHAGAKSARIRFESEAGRAKITVEDDGVGFDPTQAENPGLFRFGLRTMRERAEGVGATLEIRSAPGQGTCVILRLPPGLEGGR